MAPPRKHDTDVILDATRALVLEEGPRAASVAAIAAASGAPVGTLYHRFGNRNGVLTAAWIRALERFQALVLEAAEIEDPIEAAVGMSAASITFGRRYPEDAKLMLNLRVSDMLDGAPDTEFRERLAGMNAPLIAQVQRVALAVYGSDGARETEAVARAVVDLPYATLRRHAHTGELPEWLDADLVAATRALLATPLDA